ncbi:hypothetical protein AAVH_22134 [Aphelenchoides avenae]|nr:hypothetical protein AAVH_22134 [Aphelenchus avenae]
MSRKTDSEVQDYDQLSTATTPQSSSVSSDEISLREVLGTSFKADTMNAAVARNVLEWQKQTGRQVLFQRDVLRHDGRVDEASCRLAFSESGDASSAVLLKVRQCKRCLKVYCTDSGSFAKHIKQGKCDGPPEKKKRTAPSDDYLQADQEAAGAEPLRASPMELMAHGVAKWCAVNPFLIIEDEDLDEPLQTALDNGSTSEAVKTETFDVEADDHLEQATSSHFGQTDRDANSIAQCIQCTDLKKRLEKKERDADQLRKSVEQMRAFIKEKGLNDELLEFMLVPRS